MKVGLVSLMLGMALAGCGRHSGSHDIVDKPTVDPKENPAPHPTPNPQPNPEPKPEPMPEPKPVVDKPNGPKFGDPIVSPVPVESSVRLLSDGGTFCSGVLIAPRKVLTSAVCIGADTVWRAEQNKAQVVATVTKVSQAILQNNLLKSGFDLALITLNDDLPGVPARVSKATIASMEEHKRSKVRYLQEEESWFDFLASGFGATEEVRDVTVLRGPFRGFWGPEDREVHWGFSNEKFTFCQVGFGGGIFFKGELIGIVSRQFTADEVCEKSDGMIATNLLDPEVKSWISL